MTEIKINLSNVFDARVWADEWLKAIEQNPEIPKNRDIMMGWFANAIMAGYDFGYDFAQRRITNPKIEE